MWHWFLAPRDCYRKLFSFYLHSTKQTLENCYIFPLFIQIPKYLTSLTHGHAQVLRSVRKKDTGRARRRTCAIKREKERNWVKGSERERVCVRDFTTQTFFRIQRDFVVIIVSDRFMSTFFYKFFVHLILFSIHLEWPKCVTDYVWWISELNRQPLFFFVFCFYIL